jgi:diguanylate cyclase (GGDEF)-like protein
VRACAQCHLPSGDGHPESSSLAGLPVPYILRQMAAFKTGFLATAARYDPLTGLPLRYGIETEFKLMQRISKRYHFYLYLMMIDVDHFKHINDTYGHPAGDIALRHLAEVLKRTKRDNEPLYRFGGEEFLLLLQSDSPEGITGAAPRFLDAVRNADVPIAQDQSVRMTITIGLTRVGWDEDLGKAVERADKALFEGKRAGRDRYIFAD